MNEVTNQIAVQINQLENTVDQLREAIAKQELIEMAESSPDRLDLVREAASKPIRKVYQFDGFYVGVGHGDSIMRPDEDGDCCWGRLPSQELRNSPDILAVRIHVAPTAEKDNVLRLLGKLTEWVEREFAECPKCHQIRLLEDDGDNGERACTECNGGSVLSDRLAPVVTMPNDGEWIEF